MDLMEASQFNAPVILLQTVLEEVRHRSLPLYNRLKALVRAEDKRVWVFYNEFRRYVADCCPRFVDMHLMSAKPLLFAWTEKLPMTEMIGVYEKLPTGTGRI